MAINYVDLVSGNDGTGTGAWDNPYLTINVGCDGLVGGDEVRVAKQDSHTSLTGVFEVTTGSTTINTSTDQSAALAQYDHIHLDGDYEWLWYEVASVSTTQITLREKYMGATRITTAQKMDYIDAGDLSISGTFQQVAADDDGTSNASRLKISGGWTLSASPAQDGNTYIKQTGVAYEGYCIDIDGDYVEVSNFRAYRFGAFNNGSSNVVGCRLDNIINGDSGSNGISTFASSDFHFGTLYSTMSNANVGFNVQGNFGEIDKVIAFNCDDPPVRISGAYNIEIGEIEVIGLSGTTTPYALFINNGSDHIRIGKLSAKGLDASQAGSVSVMGIDECYNCYIGELEHDGDIDYILYPDAGHTGNIHVGKLIGGVGGSGNGVVANSTSYVKQAWPPVLSIQQWDNDPNDSRMYWNGYVGYAVKDSADARSGYCLKLTPNTSGLLYLQSPVGAAQISAPWQNIDLQVYIKDDVAFNGTVEIAAIVAGGKISEAGWQTVTPSTAYAQYTVTVSWRDLFVGQFVELWIRVSGTAGNVFVDDFSSSESAEGSTTTSTTTSSTTSTTTSSSTTTTTA